MARKKKLQELQQVDGKIHPEDNVKVEEVKVQPTLLSQIWGDIGLGKYNTLDKEVYLKRIKAMNSADLRKESIRVGIVPVAHRERLEKQLVVEFQRFVNLYHKPNNDIKQIDGKDDKYKKALEIMSAVK